MGKPVYYLDKYDLWRFKDSLQTPIGWVGYQYDSSFVSFAKIRIDVSPQKIRVKEKEECHLICSFRTPQQYEEFIQHHTPQNDTVRIGVFSAKGWIKDIYTTITLQQLVGDKTLPLTINPGLPAGKYYLRFAINSGYRKPTHNSDKIELVID